jgi:hypothetical protein
MCVLARRWRHLRRHATGLRVSCLAGGEVGRAGSPSPKRIRDFVDRILLLRGHAPLETFELRFCTLDEDGDGRRRELPEPLAPPRRGVQGPDAQARKRLGRWL